MSIDLERAQSESNPVTEHKLERQHFLSRVLLPLDATLTRC